MNLLFKMSSLLLFVFCCTPNWSQGQTSESTYNIIDIYKATKQNYDSAKMITPLITEDIKYDENIVYKKTRQKKLELDVYSPSKKSKKLMPAVILVHGGGWLTGQKENQRVMAQHLALKGFVGISIAYSLSLEARYPASVFDVKDAIKWVRKNAKKYKINPNQIAVLGADSGGLLATLAGTTSHLKVFSTDDDISEKVQAVINIDGIVSLVHRNAPTENSMASIWLNGSRDKNEKSWMEASPLQYVGEQTPPVLFINGPNPEIHAGKSDMTTLLKIFQTYTETRTIPNAPPAFWLMDPWFDMTLDYSVNFLNKVFGRS
ncbi:alpha/beta hydrolase [Pseudotamlana carrageenivorans]|uniref:Esterase n=1 Tax=Pseudotamlana carrageenivorans TaxID=2069432 RepID=A0A2I7SEN7_9FLAO|nr:alpha/beta hydrolase [Tamlana carrageenivorans]AUS04330.1 esterase [Tamlana carrageenivorans]